MYTGFGSKRKIVKHGLSHKDALKLHNRIEKSGKYDDYGMDNHRDWNDKNGKQIKESVNEAPGSVPRDILKQLDSELNKASDIIIKITDKYKKEGDIEGMVKAWMRGLHLRLRKGGIKI